MPSRCGDGMAPFGAKSLSDRGFSTRAWVDAARPNVKEAQSKVANESN